MKLPAKVLAARTATLEELIERLRSRAGQVSSLSSMGLRLSFTRVETGKVLEYKSAPGYALLQRPDSLRLVVQAPVTKSTILDISSSGDAFQLWFPRENKFFEGRNSAVEFDFEDESSGPGFSARPVHIFDALLPSAVPSLGSGLRISREETREQEAAFYTLSLYREDGSRFLRPVQRLWIERSQLLLTRIQTYAPDGALESRVEYSDFRPVQGVPLPYEIAMDRPGDGYTLNLKFKSWQLNPQIPAGAFSLSPPPRARVISLKEKKRSVTR